MDIKEMTIENATTANSTYTQVGVQCFFEREVLNQSSVLLMKFSAQVSHLRVAANRYRNWLYGGFLFLQIIANDLSLFLNIRIVNE
ncbi:MAG: hypothetical protein ACI9IP_002482 [Arcticibacterium sp.]